MREITGVSVFFVFMRLEGEVNPEIILNTLYN